MNKTNYDVDFGATLVVCDFMSTTFSTSARSNDTIDRIINNSIVEYVTETLAEEMDSTFSECLEICRQISEGMDARIYKPSVKSMKAFVSAIYDAFSTGEMTEVEEYEKNVCNLPQEVKDYIIELITK